MSPIRARLVAGGVAMALLCAAPLAAQTCFGTPARGGLSADYGRIAFGNAFGATGTIASSHTALMLNFHSLDYGTGNSGFEGGGRFALRFGAGRVSVCPALGLAFARSTWSANIADVKSTSLTGTAGIGFGYEQAIAKSFSVIPFASVRYAFRVVKYDVTNLDTDTQTTGDTLSGAEMQYGVIARYNIVYAGFIGDHALSASNPSAARGVIGITFPMRREEKK